MKVLVLICLLLNTIKDCKAEFFISPGASMTLPHVTVEKDQAGNELVNFSEALGLNLDLEYRYSIFSLVAGGLWNGSEAESQYSYTNPHDPFDTAAVPDLRTNTTVLLGFLGPRVRFIDMKYFKAFVGGGMARGFLYLSYNEDQFILATGGKIGFRQGEDRDLEGHYYEAGLDFTSRRGGALRFLIRRSEVQSMPFVSLGDRRIVLLNTHLTVQYVHPL